MFSVLYLFRSDIGAFPRSNLISDSKGLLYGSSEGGGTKGNGSIYMLSHSGMPKRLYAFHGGVDGKFPTGDLARDEAGNLYGTAWEGGATGGVCTHFGCGVVFKLDTTGKQTVLHAFTGPDGWEPIDGVIRDTTGNLHGTTRAGGTFGGLCGTVGCGVVFKLDRSGNETVLHAFSGEDGILPMGLVKDASGNLYGAAYAGGMFNGVCATDLLKSCGLIYELDPTGKETVLYLFTGGADGMHPDGDLVRDEQGNLYGSTVAGGANGRGSVFKLSPTGDLTVLYNFTDAVYGPSRLLRDPKGNLYGAVNGGGDGCVFKLDTSGNLTILHTFAWNDGEDPLAGLSWNEGSLYGTTYFGGSGCAGVGCGVVYKITP
jgi:uncharacterized repeat protein (TIGR03803 family)